MQMLTLSEETHEEQFRGRMAVKTASNQEIWNRNAVCRLRPLRRQGRKARGGDG